MRRSIPVYKYNCDKLSDGRRNPTATDAMTNLGEGPSPKPEQISGLKPMRADRLMALSLPQDRLTPEERQELARSSARTRRRRRAR